MSTKKQLSTRIASFLLTMLMVITVAPVTVINAEASGTADAQLIMDTVFAMPGETVEMNITLKNAPTVKSMSISNITFDTDKMTLTDVEWVCDAEIKNWNQSQGRGVLAFSENTDANGVVVKLTFEINKIVDDADVNVMCAMSLKRMDYADNEIPVSVSIISGSVTIRNAIRGDMDANDKLNSDDAVYLLCYVMFGKDDYPIRQSGDMDGNGKVNSNDAVYLLYHVMFGKEDYPLYVPCAHALQHVAAKAMTCTVDGNIEYWSCTKCGKCFSDSAAETVIALEDTIIKAAHNEIYIEAVPATPTSEGYKAGVWCDKCETWLSGHDVIPPIKPDESNISYRHYVQRENSFGNIEIVSDDYLSTHEIVNPNPVTYIEGVGVAELIEGVDINGKKVSSDGYSFLGWYEKPEPNAERVYSISAEARGDKILYGIWSKNVYKITYLPDSASSTLPRVEDGSFTVDKETSLKEPPEWKNLVWVGWSNDNGEIVKSIPKGTTGDITLTANWMSKRSQTVPNTKYASTNPAIVADEENGVYAFTYEIGDIQNVPIQQVEEGAEGKGFNLVKGMTHEINKTFTQKIGQGEATNIANTITLDGNNYLVSSGNNAILCKNVRFLEKEGSSATGKLRITGNVLVYGAVNGVQHVSFDSAAYNFVYLTDEEYAKMLNSHYVFFNANGGTVDTENKLIMWNSQIGELPVPTRNDCTFIGWYKTDGTQITEDTVFTELEDITVKAYWISGWVTADSLPENASIDAEKWTYTLREYTEQSTDSYSGWTKYDTKRTSWGTTQGPVYSNPSNGYRNVWSEQYVASTTTHYTFYHRYGWGYNTSTGKNSYVWGSDSQLGSGERHEIDLIYDLSKSSNFAGNSCWKGYTCPHCGQANVWLGRSTYVAENKADRWYYQEPVYTYYYYRDVSQEAMNKPDEQENISNVQKWVKYIVK